MEIKTKFSLNDKVFVIHKTVTSRFITCKACNGQGRIIQNGCEFLCASCQYSGGRYEDVSPKWQIAFENTKVGKVYVEMYYEKYYKINPKTRDREIKYMVEASGIGTGTLWMENEVFATEEEALEECKKRNAIL